MVAFSSAGFLSSIRARGSPLTNSTMSGRRSCLFSTTVKLVDGQQVVAGRVVEIDNPDLSSPYRSVVTLVLDGYTIYEHTVEVAVPSFKRRPLWTRELTECIVKGSCWKVGIEAG